MKAVILAGGMGTRLGEETQVRPKPMVEIGDRPILWHILKIYSHYGITEFVILLGYKGRIIKEYFANYFLESGDFSIDLATNSMTTLQNRSEPWKVTLLETGTFNMTGSRLFQARDYLTDTFMLTYGDGVANVDMGKLLEYHRSHSKLVTITSVMPEGRFGALEIDSDGLVKHFWEKPKGDGKWINGGFMVMEPGVFKYLSKDPGLILEREPFEQIAHDNEMKVYKHQGFWKCMDTMSDKNTLEKLWKESPAWKVWKE
ncbi:glucose-1-phosphate cytidylyltransferase [bacterium]|nr:glucose-1-phosphate cytidylyltransferase [bacterium]